MPGSGATRGSIFAIGGSEARTGDTPILARFAERCGGANARIVLVTAASSDADERVDQYGGAFGALGVTQLEFFHHRERAETDDPRLHAALDEADGVFLTGGNQLKLMTIIGGTALEAKLRARQLAGLHLAGTSAGASALGTVMLARGKARVTPRLGAIRLSPGLGVLPNAIVDQHFRERDRFGRLIAAVLSNPGMLGLGLDEDTAFELDGSGRLEVVGSGTLTIVDASELQATNIDVVAEHVPAAFAGMRMHALSAGWAYDLATGRVERPAVDPNHRRAVLAAAAAASSVAESKTGPAR